MTNDEFALAIIADLAAIQYAGILAAGQDVPEGAMDQCLSNAEYFLFQGAKILAKQQGAKS